MAGAGYKVFNTGDVLTASDVNLYLQQQTVMVFASSAARTSALSAVLAEGMVTYLQDTNSVQVYNGTAFVAVGGSSPLTTKGDLYTFSTVDARLPVGTNGQVLTADSTAATGLAFATPASGGGMTSLASGSLSGTSLTLTSISGSHKHLQLRLSDIDFSTYAGFMIMTFMGITTNYTYQLTGLSSGAALNTGLADTTRIHFSYNEEYWDTGDKNAQLLINIYNYADSSFKFGDWQLYYKPRFDAAKSIMQGTFNNSNSSAQAALTSITLSTAGDGSNLPTLSAGTYVLYGVS